MMGSTHRMFGALCGAAFATWQGSDVSTVAMTAIVATATAHGWSSPDMDLTEGWVNVRKRMPRPIAKLMNHRYITHWILWPILAWYYLPQMPDQTQWAATAILIGWCSHLLGDVIFGQIPLLPTGHLWIGLDLDTDGFIESGKAPVFGKERTIIPFGPVRVAIGLALIWLLLPPDIAVPVV